MPKQIDPFAGRKVMRSFWIDYDLWLRLREISRKIDRSQGEMMRVALANYIHAYDKKSK